MDTLKSGFTLVMQSKKTSLCIDLTLVIVYAESWLRKIKISLKLFRCHYHFILNKNQESSHVCNVHGPTWLSHVRDVPVVLGKIKKLQGDFNYYVI